jgi:hypothetical protein
MEREEPDFDEQDSGVPVTPPDRNPDPLGPEHSVPPGAGDDADEEPARSEEGGPAVPGRESGIDESNPAEGL